MMRRLTLRLTCSAAFAALCFAQQSVTPIAGPNINMVSGTKWPTGDPFLQRQNEPSMAISSRNPLHILAGANDYRTVDIPDSLNPSAPDPSGDAWLGLFKSFDGGRTWISNLVPGYPQDTTADGLASPVKHLFSNGTLAPAYAGADPAVRAGTNGMFYYAGLAFVREPDSPSAIFLARYIDDNNVEGSDTIRYLGTSIVRSSATPARDKNTNQQVTGKTQTFFEDKPSLAVDIPREGAQSCSIPGPSAGGKSSAPEVFPAGNVYMAWTEFTGGEDSDVTSIQFSVSRDCGETWLAAPLNLSHAAGTVTNQGATIAVDPNNGVVYVAWRVFSTMNKDPDEILYVASTDYGQTFSTPQLIAQISPFDQGALALESDNSNLAFRTNAYPAMAVDNYGRVYVAWSQRCAPAGSEKICPAQPNTSIDANLTARIVYVSGAASPHSCPSDSSPGAGTLHWTSPPLEIDNNSNSPGHQFMPALAFSSGKLTAAWYDQRFDDQFLLYTPVEDMGKIVGGAYTEEYVYNGGLPLYPEFGPYILDPSNNQIIKDSPKARRQTIDIRAAQLLADCPASNVFGASVPVSSYQFGPNPFEGKQITQLQVNPPNLPIFALGTEPFIGDYIDIAGPAFLPNHDGTWRYNDQPADPGFTHVVWTDNRDVIPPADNNWANYVPPTYSVDHASTFNYQTTRPACISGGGGNSGNTGDRNQNIYTSALSTALTASAPTNFKQLGNVPGSSNLIERQFPINVDNNTNAAASYKLTIVEPTSGASFVQSSSAQSIILSIPADSRASQSVFVRSSDPHQEVIVDVQQQNATGEQTSVTLNGDISNPNISNPNISNPNISNPNISNAEVYNPNISNPNISNPNISNPNISNPNISNPNISNITVANPNISNPNISNPNISNATLANPNISNPNISNPNISNPNISNVSVGGGEITDASWTVTNVGNTASSYDINVNTGTAPSFVKTQVIVSQYYSTPAAQGCALTLQSHFLPVSNHVIANGSVTPTVALKPGESAVVTVRAFDTHATNPITGPSDALKDYNPIVSLKQIASTGNNTVSNFPPPSATPPADVTSRLQITTSPIVLQLGSTIYSGTIILKNVSSAPLTGPFYLLLTKLTVNVTAANATGSLPSGPYYKLPVTTLAVGQTVTTSVKFDDPSNAAITFVPQVDAGDAP